MFPKDKQYQSFPICGPLLKGQHRNINSFQILVLCPDGCDLAVNEFYEVITTGNNAVENPKNCTLLLRSVLHSN